jgi:hypothetical protein
LLAPTWLGHHIITLIVLINHNLRAIIRQCLGGLDLASGLGCCSGTLLSLSTLCTPLGSFILIAIPCLNVRTLHICRNAT